MNEEKLENQPAGNEHPTALVEFISNHVSDHGYANSDAVKTFRASCIYCE